MGALDQSPDKAGEKARGSEEEKQKPDLQRDVQTVASQALEEARKQKEREIALKRLRKQLTQLAEAHALPATTIPHLLHVGTADPPFLPKDAPPAAYKLHGLLAKLHREVQREINVHLDLMSAGVDPDPKEQKSFQRLSQSYIEHITAYRKLWEPVVRERMREGLHFHRIPGEKSEVALTPEQFGQLLTLLERPLRQPESAKNFATLSEQGQDWVRGMHSVALTEHRKVLKRLSDLRHLIRGEKPLSKEGEALGGIEAMYGQLRGAIAVYLLARQEYLDSLGIVEPEEQSTVQQVAIMVGFIVARGPVDRFFESMRKRGRVTLWGELTRAQQARIVKEFPRVRGRLQAAGVNFGTQLGQKELRLVLESAAQTPFRSFLRDLLRHSPLDGLLFAFWIHASEDKVRGALEWASFLAVNASVGLLGRLYQRATVALLRASKSARAARILSRLTRVRVHPLLKIGIVLTILIHPASQKHIQAVVGWIDKQLSGSTDRERLGTVIGFTGYGFHVVSDLMLTSGLWLEDMEHADPGEFLGVERSRFDPEQRLYRTVADWNLVVENAAKEQTNPIIQRLYRLERIGEGWAERRAFHLFRLIRPALEAEEELAAAFVKRGIIKGRSSLDFIDRATRHTKMKRNDILLHRALSSGEGAPTVLAIRQAVEKEFPENSPVRQRWNEYRNLVMRIAREVAIYRHLNLYDHKRWFGGSLGSVGESGYQIPEFVRTGMIYEMRYRIEQRRAFTRAAYPELTGGQYGQRLAAAIRTQRSRYGLEIFRDEMAKGLKELVSGNLRSWEWMHLDGDLVDLMHAVASAGEAARTAEDKQKIDKVLARVKKLAENRQKITSYKEIRAELMKLQKYLLESVSKIERLGKLHQSLRRRLRVPAGAICLVQGSLPGKRTLMYGDGGIIDVLASAFGDPINTLNSHREYRRFDDVILLQTYRGGGDTQVFRMFAFCCAAGNPEEWEVYVVRKQATVFYRGQKYDPRPVHSIRTLRDEVIPFAQWAKENPALARGNKTLEATFVRMEKVGLAREKADKEWERKYAEKRKREEKEYREKMEKLQIPALLHARNSRDAFIEVPRDPHRTVETQYEMNYNGRRVRYGFDADRLFPRHIYSRRNKNGRPMVTSQTPEGASFDAERLRQPGEHDALSFAVGGHGIRIGSYAEFQKLSKEQNSSHLIYGKSEQEVFLDLLTTPLQGSAFAVARIINLFPHKYTDSSPLFGMRQRYITRHWLFWQLKNLYVRCGGQQKKRLFLRTLWDECAARGVIDGTTAPQILAAMQKNAKRFGADGAAWEPEMAYANGAEVDGTQIMQACVPRRFDNPEDKRRRDRLRTLRNFRDELSETLPQPSAIEGWGLAQNIPVLQKRLYALQKAHEAVAGQHKALCAWRDERMSQVSAALDCTIDQFDRVHVHAETAPTLERAARGAHDTPDHRVTEIIEKQYPEYRKRRLTYYAQVEKLRRELAADRALTTRARLTGGGIGVEASAPLIANIAPNVEPPPVIWLEGIDEKRDRHVLAQFSQMAQQFINGKVNPNRMRYVLRGVAFARTVAADGTVRIHARWILSSNIEATPPPLTVYEQGYVQRPGEKSGRFGLPLLETLSDAARKDVAAYFIEPYRKVLAEDSKELRDNAVKRLSDGQRLLIALSGDTQIQRLTHLRFIPLRGLAGVNGERMFCAHLPGTGLAIFRHSFDGSLECRIVTEQQFIAEFNAGRPLPRPDPAASPVRIAPTSPASAQTQDEKLKKNLQEAAVKLARSTQQGQGGWMPVRDVLRNESVEQSQRDRLLELITNDDPIDSEGTIDRILSLAPRSITAGQREILAKRLRLQLEQIRKTAPGTEQEFLDTLYTRVSGTGFILDLGEAMSLQYALPSPPTGGQSPEEGTVGGAHVR